MKIRTGFWVWLFMLIALYILQHTRLRLFPHILVIFWLLLPGASIANLLLARRNLRAAFSDTGSFERNTPFPFILHLINEGRFSVVKIRSETKNDKNAWLLSPGEDIRLHFFAAAPHVGSYPLPDRTLYADDPFGLFSLPLSLPAHRVWIVPGIKEITYDLVEHVQGPSPRSELFLEGRDEVAYVEPLPQGKPMRHIHWKLSARMQEWMTKHKDTESDSTRTLIILAKESIERSMRHHNDRVYDAAYTFAKSVLEQNYPLRIFTESGMSSPLYSTPQQVNLVPVHLAMLADKPPISPLALRHFEGIQSSVFVLLYSLDDTSENELLSLRGRVNELHVLFYENPDKKRISRLQKARIKLHNMETHDDTQ